MGEGGGRRRSEEEKKGEDGREERKRRAGRRDGHKYQIRSHEDSSNVYLCSDLELLMLHEEIFCGLH